MNTVRGSGRSLPTLPESQHPHLQPPSLWAAAGLIALYFLLQAVAGGLIALLMGLVSGYVRIEDGLHGVGDDIRTMLALPGRPAILVMLTLGAAAATLLPVTYRKWPSLWAMHRPPGLGVVLPANRLFFLLAILIGLAAQMLGGVLTAMLAHGKTVTQDIQNIGTNAPLALRVALVVVVVSLGPLVEELLFRGVLLSALMQRWHAGWSIAISAMIFAFAHLPGMGWQWYALPDLTLLAAALAWLRLRSGSLWPGVLAHGTNNLLAVVAWFAASGLF